MKKLIAFIGILLVMIPGVLSAYFYAKDFEAEKSKERLLSVELLAPDEILYTYPADDSPAVSLFKSLGALEEKSDKSSQELESLGKTFTLKYITTNGEYTAKVFVLKKDSSHLAYFAFEEGVYCLDDNARRSFLSFDFSLCIYDVSEIPTIKLGEQSFMPYTAEWKVRMSDGAYSDIDTAELSETDNFASAYAGPSSLSFSLQPDAYNVRVKNEAGEEIFSGDSYLFSEFTMNRSADITVTIDAMWYQSSERSYYGSASYSFKAFVTAPPEFHISSTEVQPGATLLLSCVNIPENAEITADIYPALCDVKLYRDGQNMYTFIPISYNATPGNYNLKVTCGAYTENLYFTVSNKTFLISTPFAQSAISADRVSACLNEVALAEYSALLSSIAALESETLYYEGSLADYQKIFTLYKGYGLHLRFEGSTRTARNDGVYFTAKKGSTLTSMGDGKVCAVGECAYLGRYVVVDHGYGLRSWYVTLGEAMCAVGDTVKKGDAVGKSGDTGLALNGRALVMVTVDDVPVSPYQFWEQNLDFVR